jgi:hypothetical protein
MTDVADETKVGHGFVERLSHPDYCFFDHDRTHAFCGLPRSAHTAEERKVEVACPAADEIGALPRRCHNANGKGHGGPHMMGPLFMVECAHCVMPTPAGIAERASEEEHMIGGRNRVAWESWVLHMQKSTWRFDRNDAEDVAELVDAAFRLRSEGGGEKRQEPMRLCSEHETAEGHNCYLTRECCGCQYTYPGGCEYHTHFGCGSAPSADKSWEQGYRAGLEAAAKEMERLHRPLAAAEIRALLIAEPPSGEVGR